MSGTCYKGIWSYKINIENTKNIIKQQVFSGTGQAHPSELRPEETKNNTLLDSMVGMHLNRFFFKLKFNFIFILDAKMQTPFML